MKTKPIEISLVMKHSLVFKIIGLKNANAKMSKTMILLYIIILQGSLHVYTKGYFS